MPVMCHFPFLFVSKEPPIIFPKPYPPPYYHMRNIINKPKLPNIGEKVNPSGKKVYMLDYFDIIEKNRKIPVVSTRKHVAELKAT